MKINFMLEHGENRGLYHTETEKLEVFPFNHENIEDLLCTIIHETIHFAIDKADETIDSSEEERIIFRMQWAPEWLI
tara:strand:+ start:5870 stop:6100 length:231 start_codon:yes stop_codon:yes gene_type:complete